MLLFKVRFSSLIQSISYHQILLVTWEPGKCPIWGLRPDTDKAEIWESTPELARNNSMLKSSLQPSKILTKFPFLYITFLYPCSYHPQYTRARCRDGADSSSSQGFCKLKSKISSLKSLSALLNIHQTIMRKRHGTHSRNLHSKV